MCGISVLITKELNKDNLRIFRNRLREQESRGGDSVGLYCYGPNFQKLYSDLRKTSNPLFKKLKKDVYEQKLMGQPIVILGHTRATATGTPKDFHPATDYEENNFMIHNGVIYDEHGYYYHPNDTYHLVNLYEFEMDSGKNKKHMLDRIYTNGSTIFNLNINRNILEFLRIGYTPLEIFSTKNSIFYCSDTLSRDFQQHKKGFYQINIDKLFDNKKILVEDSKKFIDSYEDKYYDQYYSVVGGGDKNRDIWNYKNQTLDDIDCPLLDGYGCMGCLECRKRNNKKSYGWDEDYYQMR